MQHFASFTDSFLAPERARLLLLLAACAIILFADSRLYAQNTNANTAEGGTRAEQPRQPKRVTPLRSSETSEGSRITVTADVPLNDYAAYRNGNRFYVVVPGAAGSGAGGGGVTGSGFDDAQVQRRGNDLVYSFRLKPGAKARVNQRFNRLDVEFAAPGGGGSGEVAAKANTSSNVSNGETRPPRQTTANTSPSPAVNSDAANQTRTLATVTPRRNEEIALNAQAPALFPNPVDVPQPVLSPTPMTSDTPPVDQIAQAQTPPVVTAPVAGTSAVTPTVGAVVARNWGWGVALVLALLVGFGLFYATRGGRKHGSEASPAPASLAEGELQSAGELALSDTGKGAIISSATTMTAPAQSAAPAVTPAVSANRAGEDAALAVASVAAARELKSPRQVAAPDDADLDDAEIVQAEVQKMLAGDEFNEKIIASAGEYARSLVTAELLAALASRSVISREAAQKAFVSYGYLDQAGLDLHNALTSAERAAAARTLGIVKSHAATPHLVRALEDKSPEVRRAAVESLAEIQDPAAVTALEATRDREKRRDMPKQLINRAIAACAAGRPAPPQVVAHDALQPQSAEAEFQRLAPPAVAASEEVATEAATLESFMPAAEPASLAGEITTAEHVAPNQAEEKGLDSTEVETLVTAPPMPLDEISSHFEQPIESRPVRIEIDSDDHIVARTTDSYADTGVEAAPFEPVDTPVLSPAPSVRSLFDHVTPVADAPPRAVEDEWVDFSVQDGGDAFEEQDVTLRQSPSVTPVSAPIPDQSPLSTEEPVAPDYEFGLAPISTSSASPFAEEPDLMGLAPIPVTRATDDATEAQTKTTEEVEANATLSGSGYMGIPENIRTRLLSADAGTRARAIGELGAVRSDEALQTIYSAFDDSSSEVHVAAVQALQFTEDDRTNAFTRALREATPERRRNIGSAIAASGLAAEAIDNLAGESREKTYEAFSLLFLMAKAGEFGTLLKAIEHSPNTEVRLAVVKLLALSGQPEVLPAFRRLAVRGSLPAEVRSAVMEAIYQIANQGAASAG